METLLGGGAIEFIYGGQMESQWIDKWDKSPDWGVKNIIEA